MKRYVLLGVYNPANDKSNITIIHASNDVNELKHIWETIDNFSLEMGETFDGALSERALKMVEKNRYLNDLFELFHDTVLWTIQVVGVFEAVKTKPVHSNLLK